jgi:hypothetical protein
MPGILVEGLLVPVYSSVTGAGLVLGLLGAHSESEMGWITH